MPDSTDGQPADRTPRDYVLPDPRAAWTADIGRVATRRRWGLALLAIAWVHLASCLGLQALLILTGGLPRWPYPVAWFVEFATVLATMRAICGAGWLREPGLAGVVVRVWGTFFILSFNMASNNQLTGWEIDWFKAAWCTLATFGFATMAWLLSLWFLVPAVGFYFLGLLAARMPDLFYLAHGLAWWLTLSVVGIWLERRRRRAIAPAALGPNERPRRARAVTSGRPGRG